MTKLTKIFTSILGISESKVTDSLSPENTSSWDSLNAIILLTEIEKAFALNFEYSEAMAIKNFGDVKKLITLKGGDPESI